MKKVPVRQIIFSFPLSPLKLVSSQLNIWVGLLIIFNWSYLFLTISKKLLSDSLIKDSALFLGKFYGILSLNIGCLFLNKLNHVPPGLLSLKYDLIPVESR